ncbi:MAG: hypothetical protein WB676_14965, partial [Bryobacteraceae bacterium]
MDKIRESFKSLHDLDFAMSKGLDLPKLSQRLDHMKTGYRIAYGVADNFAVLNQQLDQSTYITAENISDVACRLGCSGGQALLENNPLNLIECDLVVAAIVEFGRAR